MHGMTKFCSDSITKACRLLNDTVYIRRPIRKGLLELILFEVEHIFGNQYYLEVMFKAAFLLGYYGLLRVGEMAADPGYFQSNHALCAKNVHVAQNKPKIMVVLYTSITHGKESLLQKIKVMVSEKEKYICKTHFCPFAVIREYMRIRGSYDTNDEQFFIFKHGLPVKPGHLRKILRICLMNLNLDLANYDMHSWRAGRAMDLLKAGFSISQVKVFGHWRSSAVYSYLKHFAV